MTVRLLQVEPTTRCNFTCGFCAGRQLPQRDLDPALLARALDSFPEVTHLEIQGEGEPLLHPAFLDLVAEARRRRARVSTITNGSLLAPPTIERLLDLGVEKISVSIETADPEGFARLRGGSLDKVLRGVTALLDERHRRGLDRPVVGLSITVLRSTREALPALLDLYERLGLDGGLTLQPIERKDDYARLYAPDLRDDLLSPAEAEAVWIRFLADPRIRRLQRRRPPVRGFFDELMDGWSPGRRRCPWLDRAIYLGAEGDLLPCCMVKDVEAARLGRLDGSPLGGALARREELRRELAGGRPPPICRGCDLAAYALRPKWSLLPQTLRALWLRLAG